MLDFPRLLKIWDMKVGYGKPRQTCLGMRPSPGGGLIPDFSTRSCRSPREWGDGRRVIVGLDLHQKMGRLLEVLILLMVWMPQKDFSQRPLNHGRVITVG